MSDSLRITKSPDTCRPSFRASGLPNADFPPHFFSRKTFRQMFGPDFAPGKVSDRWRTGILFPKSLPTNARLQMFSRKTSRQMADENFIPGKPSDRWRTPIFLPEKSPTDGGREIFSRKSLRQMRGSNFSPGKPSDRWRMRNFFPKKSPTNVPVVSGFQKNARKFTQLFSGRPLTRIPASCRFLTTRFPRPSAQPHTTPAI